MGWGDAVFTLCATPSGKPAAPHPPEACTTMKLALKPLLVLAMLSTAASAGWAQGANKAEFLDYSTRSLISEEAAKKIMDEAVPQTLWKVYPSTRYVFISQVEGGVTPAGICAVTARVMLMPLTPTAKAVLFRPQKVATTFDAVPSSTPDQCKTTATGKLKEAAASVVAALMK